MRRNEIMLDPISKFVVDHLLDATSEVIMPAMLMMFLFGVALRMMIYYIVRSELRFAREFEKRVRIYFNESQGPKSESFFTLSHYLLEKTFNEVFDFRERFKRRNLDQVMSFTDRVFLIRDGANFLLRDTLRQIQYLRRDSFPPRMLDVSKGVFDSNPIFNRLFGVFPANVMNELINILPGLFIIGGIFGTFLGISKGLPELGNMDLGNIEETKKVMDLFLVKISQAMVKSIVGIALSVVMSLFNTLFSPDSAFFEVINRFSAALEVLWNETIPGANSQKEDSAA